MNQGSKRRFVIDSCLLNDDCKIGYVVGEEKTECEIFIKDRPITILKEKFALHSSLQICLNLSFVEMII